MKLLLGNILLALVWVGVTGDFTFGNFVLGFLVGFLSLWLLGDIVGAKTYLWSVLAAGRLMLLFSWELLLANMRLARDVLTPRIRATPSVVAVTLDATTDLEILLLALLVSLTPGTVVLDIARDRQHIYVYSMYSQDKEAARRLIKETFERGILAVTRSRPG